MSTTKFTLRFKSALISMLGAGCDGGGANQQAALLDNPKPKNHCRGFRVKQWLETWSLEDLCRN